MCKKHKALCPEPNYGKIINSAMHLCLHIAVAHTRSNHVQSFARSAGMSSSDSATAIEGYNDEYPKAFSDIAANRERSSALVAPPDTTQPSKSDNLIDDDDAFWASSPAVEVPKEAFVSTSRISKRQLTPFGQPLTEQPARKRRNGGR